MNRDISNKVVKIRKDRKCFGCQTLHPKGENLSCIVTAGEDGIESTYWCNPCNRYWEDHLSHDDKVEGISPGDMWEFHDYKEFREKYLNGETI